MFKRNITYLSKYTHAPPVLGATYVQQYLTVSIPGSRLNARNAPGTRPYCNRQSLEKKSQIERNHENLTPWDHVKFI